MRTAHGIALGGLAILAMAVVVSCASTSYRVTPPGVDPEPHGDHEQTTYTLFGLPVWRTSEPVQTEGAQARARTRTMYRRLAAISWAGFIISVVLGCLTSLWRTWGMVAVACAGCGVVLSTMSSVGHWIEIGMMVALVAVGLWLIWAERGFSVVDFMKSARGVHDDE